MVQDPGVPAGPVAGRSGRLAAGSVSSPGLSHWIWRRSRYHCCQCRLGDRLRGFGASALKGKQHVFHLTANSQTIWELEFDVS